MLANNCGQAHVLGCPIRSATPTRPYVCPPACPSSIIPHAPASSICSNLHTKNKKNFCTCKGHKETMDEWTEKWESAWRCVSVCLRVCVCVKGYRWCLKRNGPGDVCLQLWIRLSCIHKWPAIVNQLIPWAILSWESLIKLLMWCSFKWNVLYSI